MYNLRVLSQDIVEQILNTNELVILEFDKKPEGNFWKELNDQILRYKENLRIRLTGNGEDWKDLSFFKKLENLSQLDIDSLHIGDLEPINDLQKLKRLKLGEITWREYSLDFLHRLNLLETLMLRGPCKKLDQVSKLKKLKNFQGSRINVKDISFLIPLNKLEVLSIFDCSLASIEGIGNHKRLKYLELAKVKLLRDLSPLSFLVEIVFLNLESLYDSLELPDLSNCNNLKRISLKNIKNILGLEKISRIRSIEELAFYRMKLNPEQLGFIFKLPNLKSVFFENIDNGKFVSVLESKGILTNDYINPRYLQLRLNAFF